MFLEKQPIEKQYGDWLRLGAAQKDLMKGLEVRVVAVTKQKMMALEAWAAGVMSQQITKRQGRCLKPRWGRWQFPFKAGMKGVAAWVEKSASKGGKSLNF